MNINPLSTLTVYFVAVSSAECHEVRQKLDRYDCKPRQWTLMLLWLLSEMVLCDINHQVEQLGIKCGNLCHTSS
jgi:hypothetical protein